MDYRLLSPADLPQVMAVIRDAFAGAPWHEHWDDATRLQQYVEEGMSLPHALALGAFENEQLVAAALGHLRHWHDRLELSIDDFCVRRSWQQRGIGAELMAQMTDCARARGVDSITLRTRRSAPAYRFYVANGFHEAENAVFLEKVL